MHHQTGCGSWPRMLLVAARVGFVALHVFAQQLELPLLRVLRKLPAVVRRLLRAGSALALQVRHQVGLDARAIRTGRRADIEKRLAAPQRVDAAPPPQGVAPPPPVGGVLEGGGGKWPLRAPKGQGGPADATVVPKRRRR